MQIFKNRFNKVPSGPWKEDFLAYSDTSYKFISSGFECEVKRLSLGFHWCGYVYWQPNKHPYLHSKIDEIDVHGGFTWGMCGFDTAHGGDMVPYTEMINFIVNSSHEIDESLKYWTYQDVIDETSNVARQIRELMDRPLLKLGEWRPRRSHLFPNCYREMLFTLVILAKSGEEVSCKEIIPQYGDACLHLLPEEVLQEIYMYVTSPPIPMSLNDEVHISYKKVSLLT